MTTSLTIDAPTADAEEVLADGETSTLVANRATRRAAARAAGVSMMDAVLGEGWLGRAVAQVREREGIVLRDVSKKSRDAWLNLARSSGSW